MSALVVGPVRVNVAVAVAPPSDAVGDADAVRAADLRAARNLGANQRTLFLRVILPASVPYILSGVRIGIGTAFIVVIVAEMTAVRRGVPLDGALDIGCAVGRSTFEFSRDFTRAVGVDYLQRGAPRSVRAARGVVVCCANAADEARAQTSVKAKRMAEPPQRASADRADRVR